jgi:SsrA-binding protein
MKLIMDNKKARFEYHLLEKFEAGIALVGSEVKSLRGGHIQLKDSYVEERKGELFLVNAHIAPYQASSYNNHEPERPRKLLLHKEEISKITRKMREKGMTCVPVRVYLKDGRVKVEIALAKGKNIHDKKQTLKTRDLNRELSRQAR